MELSELEIYPVTKPFPVGNGKSVEMTWDANKFTGELGRRMARTYRDEAARIGAEAEGQKTQPGPKVKRVRRQAAGQSIVSLADELAGQMEFRAMVEDLERAVYADALASDRYGLLLAWGVTDKGREVAPTFDVLMRQQTARLKELLTFCREESLPQKKDPTQTTPTSPMTESTTSNGSSPQTYPPPESQSTSASLT